MKNMLAIFPNLTSGLFLLILVCTPLSGQVIIDTEYESHDDQLFNDCIFVQQMTGKIIDFYSYKKFNQYIFVRELGKIKRELTTMPNGLKLFNFINKCIGEMDAATIHDSQGKYYTDCDDYANIYIKFARFTNKERITNIKNLFFAFSLKMQHAFCVIYVNHKWVFIEPQLQNILDCSGRNMSGNMRDYRTYDDIKIILNYNGYKSEDYRNFQIESIGGY